MSIFVPATDRRRVESGPVHGRVRADLHVVLDHDDADLGQLDLERGCRSLRVAEAVGAEHDAGVDDHALADAGAVVDHDVGMKHRTGTQPTTAPHHAVRTDDHARTERRALANHGEGVHAGGGGDLGGSVHTGRAVDAGFHFGNRKERGHQVGKGPVGIVAQHQVRAETS